MQIFLLLTLVTILNNGVQSQMHSRRLQQSISSPLPSFPMFRCQDIPPPGSAFNCTTYSQSGLCPGLSPEFCADSCGRCLQDDCVDIQLEGGFGCDVVVKSGLCEDQDVILGGFCKKSCGLCFGKTIIKEPTAQISQTVSAKKQAETLINFRDSFQNPEQLPSWNGDDPCNDWWRVNCTDGLVSSILLFKGYGVQDLSTSIPPEFSNLQTLQQLWLIGLELTGSIPPELSTLDLRYLDMFDNQLTGMLPPELSSCVKMEYFSMALNKISGSLPVQFSEWNQLEQIVLDNNDIRGTLPKEYSAWNNIFEVSLEGNKLSGQVPKEYSSWDAYVDMYFSPQSGGLCIDTFLKDIPPFVYIWNLEDLIVC